MSEPTREQKRIGLAQAMGYTARLVGGGWTIWALFSPLGNRIGLSGHTLESDAWTDAPNPYESAEDKDALLEWLTADDARWKEFKREMLMEWTSSAEQDVVRFMLTAPREVIADAAWLALMEASSTSQ